MKTTLIDYLDELRTCSDDERLRWELSIYDNYPIHLYGESDLFSRVTQAFRDSPHGSLSESWHLFFERAGDDTLGFNYGHGTVQVYVWNEAIAIMKDQNMKINGRDPSVTLMVHPSQYDRQYQDFSHRGKEMEGVSSFRALAIGIVALGEYIIQERLTARFTKNGLDITYIPK